jgi:cell division protein FtsB
VKCVGLRAVTVGQNESEMESVYILNSEAECVDEESLEVCRKLAELCPESTEMVVSAIADGFQGKVKYDDIGILLYWLLDDEIDGYKCEINLILPNGKTITSEKFVPTDELYLAEELELELLENFKKVYRELALNSFYKELIERVRAGILKEKLEQFTGLFKKLLSTSDRLKKEAEQVRENFVDEERKILKHAQKSVDYAEKSFAVAQAFLNTLINFNSLVYQHLQKELQARDKKIKQLEKRIKELEEQNEKLENKLDELEKKMRLFFGLKETAEKLVDKVKSKIKQLSSYIRRKISRGNDDIGPSL